MLILVLLLFVVGQDYKEQPEEYGVAINFGDGAPAGGNMQPNITEDIKAQPQEEIEEETEEIVEEEAVEEEIIEEAKEEEIDKEKLAEEKLAEEKAAEEKANKEIEEAKEKAEAAEKLLLEEAEEAEKLKAEAEAKKKAETEAKEKKEAATKAKAEKDAKAAKAKAKAENDAKIAKAKAVKAKAAAKAKTDAQAKAKADAKASADAKAAAAAKKAKEGSGGDPFAVIENAPIYPGCERGNNETRKKCLNDKITQFISKNYDTDLAADLTGTQKINISFKVNTSGYVTNINVRAKDPRLEEEAKRVIKQLPKMKPAMQQGKAVVFPYGLPIRIKMQD